jgi:hypothetical protein
MKTIQRLTAPALASLSLLAQPAFAATRNGPGLHSFAVGLLVMLIVATTVLGIAIALLGNPGDRWGRSAVRGGATGLGSILMVLLVLGVLIHVG